MAQDVDYAALAQAHGALTSQPAVAPMNTAKVNGETVPVDYDELAKAHGALTSAAAPPAATAPPKGFLGDSKKPSVLTGPPTLGERVRTALPAAGGLIGGVAGTAVGGPPGGVAGAGLGGWAGRSVEQASQAAFGQDRSTPATNENLQNERLGSGAEQAAYDLFGHAVLWPVNALGRRIAGSSLSKSVTESLASAREGLGLHLRNGLQAAQDLLGKARVAGAEAKQTAATTATAGVRDAATTARAGIQEAKQQTVEELAQAQRHLPADAGVTNMEATHHVADVVRGPAQGSKDKLGRAVEDAATSGPTVNWAPIKAKAQAMTAKADPAGVQQTFQDTFDKVPLTGLSSADQHAALQQAGVPVEPSHPLPTALQQILQAPDTISFADAHKYKRLLDDATNWESPAKKQVQQITKGVRGEIRGAMVGHAPYDEATAAYQQAAPLFSNKQLGQKLVKVAQGSPGQLTSLIKAGEPVRASMLRDLLLEHGGPQGAAAWDSVRAAWTHEKLVQGPIENLTDRVAKLTPEFQEAFYGDAAGQKVLTNLRSIGRAVDSIVSRGAADLEAAKGAGRSGVEAVRTAGEQQVAQTAATVRDTIAQHQEGVTKASRALAASRPPTATEVAFSKSSIAKTPPPTVGDHVVAALTPAKLSWMKYLKGPTGQDLVTWASYGDRRTKALIQAVTSNAPGEALANLARAAGLAEDEEDLKGPKTVVKPQPQPARPPAPGAPPPP